MAGTEVEGCVAGIDAVGAMIVSGGGVSFAENNISAKTKNAVVMENVKARCML